MKCHYCGAEVAENQNYCLWCGTRQDPGAAPQPETTVPVQEEAAPQLPVQQEMPPVQPAQPPVQPAQPPVQPAQSQPSRPVRRYPPRLQLPTHRGLGKMIFLGILTLGIYPTVIYSRIVTELNIAVSRYDGKRTIPYFGMLLLTPITLGIFAFVWMHRFCRRIGDELRRRRIDYKFGPATFWLWNILGSLIIVGPFIFLHKLMKSMNRINTHYNTYG